MPSNSNPLVSVGLTTYRRPEGLRKILDCVINQTYKNLDIVVSDNCSSMAEVEEVLEELASRDNRIRVFRQELNIGMVANQTFVARHSIGDFFLWLQDDDEVPQNYIERCIARFSDSPQIELVGAVGDRYLEGRYWYTYWTYSNVGESIYTRLGKLISIAYSTPSAFEHYFYGVFRRDALLDCIWKDGECYYKELFSMFFRLSERGFIHVADDVTLKKFNEKEDIQKWRDAKYYDRPLRYKFAGSKIEELIPRTLNIITTVSKSKKLTLSEKFRLIALCFPHFFGALTTGREPLWKRIAKVPRRLVRKGRHVIRLVLGKVL